MSLVVDSCVILDVAFDDPTFGQRSAACVEAHLGEGLVACPVTLIEIVPEFGGNLEAVRRFLRQCGIESHQPWCEQDTEQSARGWVTYVRLKRSGRCGKRPLADLLIGGFACRFRGIITRNGDRFRPYFPELAVIEP